MSGHRTTPPHIVTASTRRVWSADEKTAIIAETEISGATVSMVARRHNIHASLLFRWRRDAAERDRVSRLPPQPAFVPLALPAPEARPVAAQPCGTIEIELAGGHRVRADASVDLSVLRGLLQVLVGR